MYVLRASWFEVFANVQKVLRVAIWDPILRLGLFLNYKRMHQCRVDFKSNMCVQLNKTHIGGIGFGQKVADKKYLLVACARPRNVCYPTV